MKKKTEIQQIDFYEILSRETKVISNSNSNPVVIVQKDTPEHFDLEIRSQIHGYNLDRESMNQARDLIGHDHIPLRSIRFQLCQNYPAGSKWVWEDLHLFPLARAK